MVRKRRKKALYEVIGGELYKPGYGKSLEPLQPKTAEQAEPQEAKEKKEPQSFGRPAAWPKRPKPVQFNAGRIEFSLPYTGTVAVVLTMIALLLLCFRLGQSIGARQTAGLGVSDDRPGAAQRQPSLPDETSLAADTAPARETAPVDTSAGSNRIVIQTYQARAHLEPVKDYFKRLGIKTEILRRGEWYYLVTVSKYDNPERTGTDGYRAKQRIIKLGENYKAPEGYETFGTRPFHDAYGMKFD